MDRHSLLKINVAWSVFDLKYIQLFSDDYNFVSCVVIIIVIKSFSDSIKN